MYLFSSKLGSTAIPSSPPSPPLTSSDSSGSGASVPSWIILRLPPLSVNRAVPSGSQSMLHGITRFLATTSVPTPGWRSPSVALAVKVRTEDAFTAWSGISARTGAALTSLTTMMTSCELVRPFWSDTVTVRVWPPFCISVGIHSNSPVAGSMVAPSGSSSSPYIRGAAKR